MKSGLRAGNDVSAALYDAGYGSPSRVYEQGAAKLGMTPATYRAGGAGMQIRWALVETVLGNALVAATERGICAVELGEDAARAGDSGCAIEFPHARHPARGGRQRRFPRPRLRAVAERLAGCGSDVPVDLIGTAFQKRVWDALMKIPAWPDPQLCRTGRCAGRAQGRARGRRRLVHQPRRDRGAVPSRHPRRWFAGRLPMGPADETGVCWNASVRRRAVL